MPKINDTLRKKLLDQRKEMGSGGLLIANKDWIKGRVRVLPCGNEIPGHRVVSYYCESLQGDRKGTTSPLTFGLPCPIEDAFRKLKGEEKEVRDRAYNLCRTTTEYWVPVVVRGEEGTVDAPNVRIFPMKKSVYGKVQGFMIDEDIGEDITDPVEGRDLLIKKTGSQKNTEWTVDKLDKMPLHKDKAMRAAIIAAGNALDVRQHFFGVDYEILAKIYEALTGEEMPPHYQSAAKKAGGAGKAKPKVEDADDSGDGAEGSEGAEDAAEESTGEDAPTIEEGSRVSFTDADDNTIEGEVTGIEGDEVTVKDDDGGEWQVDVSALTLVEAEATAEDGEGEATEEGAESGDESEATPEIEKGSRVSFDNEGDTVAGVVTKLKGDDATVKDDDGGEWELDVSLLTLVQDDEAGAEDAGEPEPEPEEAAPKVTRKAPAKPVSKPAPAKPAQKTPAKPAAKPATSKPAAVPKGTVARKPAPAGKASDKIRKAGKK